MAIRECVVRFRDFRGVQHETTVQATSVLEAAGLGLKILQGTELLDTDDGIHEIIVEVVSRTTHTVPVLKLREWSKTNCGSPQEMRRKANTR